jgi:hypothetical protein
VVGRLAEVAAAEYQYDGHLIRVDDTVLEQFARGVLGSERIPLAWLAVGLESRKHDQVRVEIGMASSPDAPFYSSPAFREARFNFEIPAGEEANLRAFLDAAARSVGRAT